MKEKDFALELVSPDFWQFLNLSPQEATHLVYWLLTSPSLHKLNASSVEVSIAELVTFSKPIADKTTNIRYSLGITFRRKSEEPDIYVIVDRTNTGFEVRGKRIDIMEQENDLIANLVREGHWVQVNNPITLPKAYAVKSKDKEQ